MVGSRKRDDELPWFLLHLADLNIRVILLEDVGVDETSFMPEVLSTVIEPPEE